MEGFFSSETETGISLSLYVRLLLYFYVRHLTVSASHIEEKVSYISFISLEECMFPCLSISFLLFIYVYLSERSVLSVFLPGLLGIPNQKISSTQHKQEKHTGDLENKTQWQDFSLIVIMLN